MSCLPQSCMACVYLWNECQAWYQVRPMLASYPCSLPAKSPDMRLGLWVEICFTTLISEMSFYGMRVRLAGGSRNTFISTRADLDKKEGGGSQKNEVGDAAYFVRFTLSTHKKDYYRYRIAGNFREVQIFTIFATHDQKRENKNREIRNRENLNMWTFEKFYPRVLCASLAQSDVWR